MCVLHAVSSYIAASLSSMVQLTLTLNGTGEERGDLHFSLFRGAHSITPRISTATDEPDTDQYLIRESKRLHTLSFS